MNRLNHLVRSACLIGALASIAGGASATSALVGNASNGKALFSLCATCHGQNGEGTQALGGPRLAGQDAWYLTRQLNAFRNGVRGTASGDILGAQMRPMALQLSGDQAVADAVAYIRTLKSPAAAASGKGNAEHGKALYVVCAACHGPKGAGLTALNAPRIAGQHAWYLTTQLGNYRNGRRGADVKDAFGMQMAPMAKTLANDAAIADVAAYVSGLK